MNTLLINQPGRHGDILICLPIARWFSHAYKVDWLCPEEYHIDFRNINYCTPVLEVEKSYNKIIDMSFGIRQGTNLHQWWIDTRPQWQSFVIPKYYLAGVPLSKRWCLTWERNKQREEDLYIYIINKYGLDYTVVQERTHDFAMDIKVNNDKALFEPIEDFNVFDWYKVLLNAREIHCIDSCLANFVEVIPELMMKPKFYYATSKVPNIWDRTLLVNNWRFV